MLTINDERWLEGRKVLCPRCDHYRDHVEGKSACFRGEKSGWMQAECRFFQRKDLIPDYKDVAEFETLCYVRGMKGMLQEWHKEFGEAKDPCVVCHGFRLAKLNDKGVCVRTDEECRQMWSRILTELEMPV